MRSARSGTREEKKKESRFRKILTRLGREREGRAEKGGGVFGDRLLIVRGNTYG